jgi:hypothetical protein
MSNVKISELTSGTTLTGSEEIPIVQSGSTVKTTVQDIVNLAGGSPTLDVVTVGTLGTTPLKVTYETISVLNPSAGTQNAQIIDVPSINIGGMGFTGTLSSISFPTLTLGIIIIQGISTLTTIDLPVLETTIVTTMFSILIQNNSSLTTLNIPSLLNLPTNITFIWTGNAFSQTTVDNILLRMVASGRTGGIIDLSGGTSSTPSVTGLAAKSTLEGLGWTVTVN